MPSKSNKRKYPNETPLPSTQATNSPPSLSSPPTRQGRQQSPKKRNIKQNNNKKKKKTTTNQKDNKNKEDSSVTSPPPSPPPAPPASLIELIQEDSKKVEADSKIQSWFEWSTACRSNPMVFGQSCSKPSASGVGNRRSCITRGVQAIQIEWILEWSKIEKCAFTRSGREKRIC